MTDFWTNNEQFDKYEQAFGSTFAAINYIAKLARHRRNAVGNCILESQAIAWVITGVEPQYIKDYYEQLNRRKQRNNLYVQDRILYIDDNEIRDAVESSIAESQQLHYLVYRYNNIIDAYEKARVRIICNMIWDELLNLEAEDII